MNGPRAAAVGAILDDKNYRVPYSQTIEIVDMDRLNLMPISFAACQSVYSKWANINLEFQTKFKDELLNQLATDNFVYYLLNTNIDWKQIMSCQTCYCFFMIYKLVTDSTRTMFWKYVQNFPILCEMFSSEVTTSILHDDTNIPIDVFSLIFSYDVVHEEITLERRLEKIFQNNL